MQIAYATDEESHPRSCFSEEEIDCLESQIEQLEGKTEKLKNPYRPSDLKSYGWTIARLGGWKRISLPKKTWHNRLLGRTTKVPCYHARLDTL